MTVLATDMILDALVSGTYFETDDDGATVELEGFDSAHPVATSWNIGEDQSVHEKLTAEWEHVVFLHYEDTGFALREANLKKAVVAVTERPGVYAVETFLDGHDGWLATHLLRFVGEK